MRAIYWYSSDNEREPRLRVIRHSGKWREGRDGKVKLILYFCLFCSLLYVFEYFAKCIFVFSFFVSCIFVFCIMHFLCVFLIRIFVIFFFVFMKEGREVFIWVFWPQKWNLKEIYGANTDILYICLLNSLHRGNAIKNQERWSMIHSLSSKTFVIPAVWWMYSLGGEDQSPIKLSPALYLPPPTTKGQSESLKARSSSWVQSLKVPKMTSAPLKIKTDEFLCTLETLHPVRE